MYISNKAVYMGNPFFNRDENTLKIRHSNASLKMKGFGAKNTPYDIHSFAKDGFGTILPWYMVIIHSKSGTSEI